MKKQQHARTFAATTVGIDAFLIEVEADLSFGFLNFCIVGLPDKSIKESKDRIRAALKNTGLKLPDRLITINLAPADIKKQEALFDVPITIAILQAAGIISLSEQFLEETIFLGELSLDGLIRGVKGALSIAHAAKNSGKKRIILPVINTVEVSAVSDLEIIGVSDLRELVAFLSNDISITPTPNLCKGQFFSRPINSIDYSQVKGQTFAKKALVVAAVGEHNILFVGPPGAGKTMLAERFATIKPPLDFEDAIEVTKIYSVAGLLTDKNLVQYRPFRSPHHTVSQVGLSGGGSIPIPGEISLAHKGILFLDEMTEFSRNAIEILRQPLENRSITISRAGCSVSYPADFSLIGALNPCPCGYYKDGTDKCKCSELIIKKYLAKLSGPILDRIDIHVSVSAVKYQELADQQNQKSLSSDEMFALVEKGLKFRIGRGQDVPNAKLTTDQIKKFCAMTAEAEALLKAYFEKNQISARSYHKILKLARSISDILEKEQIDASAIKQAIIYRAFDRSSLL